MSRWGARRFVADLLGGRRPRSFRARETDVDELRAAITLRTARPGKQTPSEEFVTDLHRRLAQTPSPASADSDVRRLPAPGTSRGPDLDDTRRRLVTATSLAAAAAAVVGAVTDHTLSDRGPAQAGPGGEQTLIPNTGQWRTVSASAELPEGGARGFDLGTVVGFVSRAGGELRAVSGVCTHLGCRLALDAAARRLNCPCHTTSFALGGQLLHYQLAVPPAALPRLEVRETQGMVQVFAPPGSRTRLPRSPR